MGAGSDCSDRHAPRQGRRNHKLAVIMHRVRKDKPHFDWGDTGAALSVYPSLLWNRYYRIGCCAMAGPKHWKREVGHGRGGVCGLACRRWTAEPNPAELAARGPRFGGSG